MTKIRIKTTEGYIIVRLYDETPKHRDIPNDGKQKPMRHGIFPPFIAQHATGCCCCNCLQKWHGIPKGRQLTPSE